MKKIVMSLGLIAAMNVPAAMVIEFGNDGVAETPGVTGNFTDSQLSALMTNTTEASSYTVGSFSVLPSGNPGSGVTFDIMAVSSANRMRAQGSGLGVNDAAGAAGSAIDNGSALEWISLEIKNATGLGAGDQLVFTSMELLYGSTGETYRLSIGASGVAPAVSDAFFTTGGGTPDAFGVNSDAFTIGAGSQGTTSFALGSITVDVIPEPGTIGLLVATSSGLLFCRRLVM